jgi:hypothetical protein
MDKQKIAEQEIEAFQWMKKKGYDRKACKDISPLLVKYHNEQCNIADVSKCKHDCETIKDVEGFEVCANCGQWGENC